MATNKIRVGQKEKLVIEVNDAGECIEINVSDKRLTQKLAGLVKRLKTVVIEATEKQKQLAELDPKSAGVDSVISIIEYEASISQGIIADLDDVFGVGTCRKVFGDGVIPSLDDVQDFLNQLTPFIARAVQERRKAIGAKYAPSRRGGV